MVVLRLSNSETKILEDIDEVGHGTLFNIKASNEEPKNRTELPDPYLVFFRELKENEIFHRLILHGGLPAYAEIDGKTENGTVYVRKIKFN